MSLSMFERDRKHKMSWLWRGLWFCLPCRCDDWLFRGNVKACLLPSSVRARHPENSWAASQCVLSPTACELRWQKSRWSAAFSKVTDVSQWDADGSENCSEPWKSVLWAAASGQKNKEQLFSMLVDFSFTIKKKGLRKLLIFAKGLHVCMLTWQDLFVMLLIKNVSWHQNEVCLVYIFIQFILFFLYNYCWGLGFFFV